MKKNPLMVLSEQKAEAENKYKSALQAMRNLKAEVADVSKDFQKIAKKNETTFTPRPK